VRRLLIVCVFTGGLLALAGSSHAQQILPSSFGGWTTNPGYQSRAATADAQDAFREYGLLATEDEEYQKGAERLSVRTYQMAEPSAAYGAFTYLRAPAMASLKIGKYSAASSDHALIVVGNLLLEINGAGAARMSSDLSALADSVKSKADARPFPSLGEHLPSSGIVIGSEHYYLGPVALNKVLPVAPGDWVGFGDRAEALSAQFQNGTQAVTLLLIDYPTQELAAKHFDSVQASAQSSSVPGLPFATAERKGEFICVAFGQRGAKYAAALLKQIETGHNVIWNEPSYKATDLTWASYVVGAFTGTGIIMLLAFVSGIGFGIIRVAVKYFFPGKVFDRPKSIEVIQLGLTGKRVNTKDFY